MKAVAVIVAVFLVTFALDHYVANKKKPPVTMAYGPVEKQWAKEYNIYGPLPKK